jgi:hypothetical protein
MQRCLAAPIVASYESKNQPDRFANPPIPARARGKRFAFQNLDVRTRRWRAEQGRVVSNPEGLASRSQPASESAGWARPDLSLPHRNRGRSVTGPPASRPATQPSIRLDAKQGRAEEARARVRVVSDSGVIDVCDEERARRLYGSAPNAEPMVTHGGRLVAIFLRSFGDDRGQVAEACGQSTKTTWREPLDSCRPIIQHKRSCQFWPQPAVSK